VQPAPNSGDGEVAFFLLLLLPLDAKPFHVNAVVKSVGKYIIAVAMEVRSKPSLVLGVAGAVTAFFAFFIAAVAHRGATIIFFAVIGLCWIIGTVRYFLHDRSKPATEPEN
jgi:hypothetical protein